MKNLDKPLSPEEIRYLTDFLAKEHEANGALTIHQLRGFLWAVASSPEMIQPSEWLPVVLNDEEQGNMPFRHQAEAERFMGVVLRLYNQINQQILSQTFSLPDSYGYSSDPLLRLPLTEWCDGFLTGHDWLSEVWAGFGFDIDEVAEEEPESELHKEMWAVLSVITTLVDVDLALEGAEEPDKLRASLPVLVEKVFPNAVEQYAFMGRQLGEMAANEVEEPYIAPPKIGRNDPCPCGSGKKYKKCCGA